MRDTTKDRLWRGEKPRYPRSWGKKPEDENLQWVCISPVRCPQNTLSGKGTDTSTEQASCFPRK
jgi:hypothetical protein